jgi:hypothetical protein
MFSFIGDTVLDPFAGSGTTLKVAKSLFRRAIGYEINESFRKVVEKKIKVDIYGNYKDFQYLLYRIYQKGSIEGITFNFEKQKQKGIVILKNGKNVEVVLDYLLFEDDMIDTENIIKEFKSKFEENTVRNYFKEEQGWKIYKNYIIVVNAPKSIKTNIIKIGINQSKAFKISKKIQIIPFDEMISDSFQINKVFQ